MKKTAIVIGAMLIAVVAHAGQEQNSGNAFFKTRVPLESKAVKGAPYSAETVTDHVQLLADGNRIVEHSTGRVYRDKDGRVRREEDRPSGGVSVSIVDPVAGVSYSLDPQNRVAWKTPTPSIMMNLAEAKAQLDTKVSRMREAGEPAEALSFEVVDGRMEVRRRTGASERRNEEPLTARTIEGVLAQGHRTTTTIAAGAIGNDLPIVVTSEEWTSPDLQVLVFTERKDPRNGDSTYRLLNVNRADPDPSLFQVPADYTMKETGIRRLERQ
ncbi:MAG TPA: hypothetical protein VGJ29_00125 [Vicinamibacterales bacterium]|jgi:hypothetical protein